MKKYVFKPYNQKFPKLFEKEKKRISSYSKKLHIEHVGSTAVPGLGGKGIIDIAIAVMESEIGSVSKHLQDLGYEFRQNGSTPNRLFFRIDLPDLDEGKRRYHAHLLCIGNKEWEDLLAFRDYLTNHPEEAKKYEDLKKKASVEVEEDGAKYRELKDPLFKKILKQIKEEFTS
jgi:GrpB-like predicted nucleotidyltransferase (UPF0157 family)